MVSLRTLTLALALTAYHRVAGVEGPSLSVPAGPGLEGAIRYLGLPVWIDLQPTGTPDAYGPTLERSACRPGPS